MKKNLKEISHELLELKNIINSKISSDVKRKEELLDAMISYLPQINEVFQAGGVTGIMLRDAFLKLEEQERQIAELNAELISPIRYYSDMEAILEHDKNFYDAQKKLSVKQLVVKLFKLRLIQRI